MRTALFLSIIFSSALITSTIQATAAPSHKRANTAHMMIGDKNDHVDITIQKGVKAVQSLTIETTRVGVPGARLRLSVDKKKPFLTAILTDKDCHFNDGGSVCMIVYKRGTSEFATANKAFRTSKTAHVEIENAGNMAMSRDVSLTAFSKQLKK